MAATYAKTSEPESKRPRLEPEDESGSSDSDVETVYSYQGYETAIVRDSGDDWSPDEDKREVVHNPSCIGNYSYASLASRIPATMVNVEEEYEIATDSDSSSMGTDSSSGMEDNIMPIVASSVLSDAGFCADTSEASFSDEDVIIRSSPPRSNVAEANSDSDHEIPSTDKWKCVVCHRLNTPKIRYCNACYQVRKGWLPPRPTRRVRNRRKAAREAKASGSQSTDAGMRPYLMNSVSSVGLAFTSKMDLASEDATEDVVDGPVGHGDNASSSQEIPQPLNSQETEQVASSSQNGSQEANSITGESVSDSARQPSSQPCTSSQDSGVPSGSIRLTRREWLCDNCGMRPCNGGFLHGRTSHFVYCYYCSKQMWRARKTCPVCRRTIQQVIKIFIV